MAFPTICESDLIKNIMPLIRAGKNVETIVNEIQNPLFSVLTINMKSLSLGNAEHQRTLLSVILQLYPSAIIFCQEPPENFAVPDTAWFTPVKDKTTAVVWTTEQFNTTELKETEGILDEMLKTMEEDETLRSRLSMVRLTTTEEPTKSTLAVSYHGPHKDIDRKNMDIDRKSALLSRLLSFLEESDIDSFIVGGDFNLDTTKLNMEKLSNVKVGDYTLTPRAEKANATYIAYKDNFFWSTKITIHDIKALKGSAKYDCFDHDPIVGNLVFDRKPDRPVEENGKPKDCGRSVDSDELKDSDGPEDSDKSEPRTSPTR